MEDGKPKQQEVHNVNVLENSAQPDVEYKDFWRNPEHFADLFNGVCFRGSDVIQAEDLEEMDVESSGVIEYEATRTSIVRTRDIIKKAAYGIDFLILAIENQDTIDYTMPLRVMVYDGQNYLKELKQKKENGCEGKQRYQISPVITIVMYYGSTPWHGPLCLIDMMGELNPEIKKIISDYKMHLVDVLRSNVRQFQNQDVRQVMEYAQAFMKKDMNQVEQLSQNEATTLEVAYMVGKITKSQEVIKKIVENHQLESKKEEVDMCEFITELIEDGELRGELRGKAKGMVMTLKLLDYPNEAIISNLVKNLNMTENQAMEYLG